MILQSYSEINSLHEIQVFVITCGYNIFGVRGEDDTFFLPGHKGDIKRFCSDAYCIERLYEISACVFERVQVSQKQLPCSHTNVSLAHCQPS